LPIVLGLLLVVLVAVVAAGPLGVVGGSAGPTATPGSAAVEPTARPKPTALITSSPSGTDDETTPAVPAVPSPAAPAAGPIADVAFVPVTNFRATPTATDLAEVKAVLAGTSKRYKALELISAEADGILAALGVERPADATRLILARDAAALAADLTKTGKRLAFLSADAVGPEVRALAWGEDALFGVDRVHDLADWPLTARLPGTSAADAFDPSTTWTFAGGDIMLDRGVYETLAVKGKGADFPFDGGTAEITGRCKDCSPLGWDTPYTKRTGNAGAFRNLIKGADIAIANFENPAPNKWTWHTRKTVFSANPKFIDGLAKAGLDYLSLANNHIRDAGGWASCRPSRTSRRGASRCPAPERTWPPRGSRPSWRPPGRRSRSSATTRSPATTTRPPRRSAARPSRPRSSRRTSPQRARPGPTSSSSSRTGASNTTRRLRNQKKLARMASTRRRTTSDHAHWAAAMEIYKGRPIWYALGNFVFDQTWSEPTMEGITLELTFRGTDLAQVRIRPHIILDKAQPNFLDPAGDGKVVMGQVFTASKGLLPW
jgi:hypothetical protein